MHIVIKTQYIPQILNAVQSNINIKERTVIIPDTNELRVRNAATMRNILFNNNE